MILIISLCKEKLHDLEFVKPIEKVVSSLGEKCSVKNYIEVAKTDLEKADKVLLSGTSLMDFDYFNHMDKFSWLKDCEKPVLGICAGMEIIVHEFGGKIEGDGKKVKDKVEIGANSVNFEKDFLGISKGKHKVYSLHQLGVRKVGKNFEVYAKSNKGIQAIKHRSKGIYGVLFHPEVYNHEVIENFVKIN
jgi:GMP synthase (glutamine-hydrolysing)